MLWTMPLVRYLLVSLLTLALTVGTGWQSCATLQHSCEVASIELAASHQGHDNHQHAAAHGVHGLGGDRNLLLANKGEPISISHACLNAVALAC